MMKLPFKMTKQIKKTLLIFGAVVFVLLYVSLVRAAAVRKKPPLPPGVDDPVDAANLPAEVVEGIPGELVPLRREAHHRAVVIGERFLERQDADEQNEEGNSLDKNEDELKEDKNEEEEKEEDEEEERDEAEKGEDEDEDEEIKEGEIRLDREAEEVKDDHVEEEEEEQEEEGDGAGDEGEKQAASKDDGKLRFHRGERHDKGSNPRAKENERELRIEDIQPPDHMDAVRMEKDGHLNRDYKKEIFLGNHEEMEDGTDEEKEQKLRDIFFKMDTNYDGRVTQQELEDWILLKVEEHFKEAVEENEKIFASLDMDGDKFIGWKEFHYQFLKAKGYKDPEIGEGENYDDFPLDPAEREVLIRHKFRWAEADEEPQDNQLTLEEFQNFRHPEQSRTMMEKMVEEILHNLDINRDDIISEDEFAALPAGEEYDQMDEADKSWQAERKREFNEMIDLNHDGKVDKKELMNYVDPKNPNHSKVEAENLVEMADENNDHKLSLTEVLQNRDMFFGSKVMDTGRNFHDEF